MNLSKKITILTLSIALASVFFLMSNYWYSADQISNRASSGETIKSLNIVAMVFAIFAALSLIWNIFAFKADMAFNKATIAFIVLVVLALLMAVAQGALVVDMSNNPLGHLTTYLSDAKAMMVLPTIAILFIIPASITSGFIFASI